MKKLLCLPVMLFVIFLVAPAFALTLSLEPSTQYIALGGTADFDLNISELGDRIPDSLGAFSLNIVYDDSILSFDSVSFGSFLGDTDPFNFETDIWVDDSVAGSLYLEEGSWLFDYELDALQPDSFTLATISFSIARLSTSSVAIENVVLSDAYGFELSNPVINNASVAPVPEPATVLLLTTGLVSLGFCRKKRKA